MKARMLFAYCICAALAGCASTPQIEYRTVPVPIPVPCAVAIPPRPDYPVVTPEDDVHTAAKKRMAEREMRIAREIELEAASRGCTAQK